MSVVHLHYPPGSVIYVPGDSHFGSQDDRAHRVAWDCARDAGVTHVLSLGDTFSFYALSQHPKERTRLMESGALQLELEEALPWLEEWRGREGRTITLGPGNHEERWYRFVEDNPGFAGTQWWHEFRGTFATLGIRTLPRKFTAVIGKLAAFHGHTARGHRKGTPADSLATMLRHYPAQNTMYGHTHRVGMEVKTTWKHGIHEQHCAINVGHLESLDEIQSYQDAPSMQQGFVILRIFPGGYFEAAPHTIHPLGKTGRRRVVRSALTGKEYRA